MRLKAFIEMLRQMAGQFTISEIVSVIFVVETELDSHFLLHMQNGEYWMVTNAGSSRFSSALQFGTFELFKFLPPIPALSQFPYYATWGSLVPDPLDLNTYLKENNCSETLYLPDKDRENP